MGFISNLKVFTTRKKGKMDDTHAPNSWWKSN